MKVAGVKGRSGGSNRKSVAEHERDGTFRNDKHSSLLVKPDHLTWLEMPTILDHTQPVTKEIMFKTISAYLYKYGQSAAEDELMLSLLVDQVQIYRDAKEIYETEGATATIGRKLASTVISDIGKEISRYLAEFHLTKNTRAPIPIEGDSEEVDPVADFLKGNE